MADAGKGRGHSNSFAATNGGRPAPAGGNDGEMTSPPVEEPRPQGIDNAMTDSQEQVTYGIKGNSSQQLSNSPPRDKDGDMTSPPVEERRTHGIDDIQGIDNVMADSQEQGVYGIQSNSSQQISNSPPRDHRIFGTDLATTVEATSKPNSTLEPPVTKGTLSELDVNKIVHNPKLRHDINFDPDLHFRPNLDGEKGRRKTQRANHFWETMRCQLREYIANREQFEALGEREWCLPATLRAIQGILETLVPQRDRAAVEETFNVDLLMQQFRKGVADLVKLAVWLSQLLKCHCAPMRDDWVDEMVMQLSNGDRNGDVAILVAGMQNLLGVLEAMKLVSEDGKLHKSTPN